MTLNDANYLNFKRMEDCDFVAKIKFRGKVYDYGYWPGKDMVVLYEPGCCNMQDAIAVLASECEIL